MWLNWTLGFHTPTHVGQSASALRNSMVIGLGWQWYLPCYTCIHSQHSFEPKKSFVWVVTMSLTLQNMFSCKRLLIKPWPEWMKTLQDINVQISTTHYSDLCSPKIAYTCGYDLQRQCHMVILADIHCCSGTPAQSSLNDTDMLAWFENVLKFLLSRLMVIDHS